MCAILIAAAVAAAVPMTAPGPLGPLAGALLDAQSHAPVVLIIPGSGPTDRDGNNPLGVTSSPNRLLAEALASAQRPKDICGVISVSGAGRKLLPANDPRARPER
jgi:hypothetical protein